MESNRNIDGVSERYIVTLEQRDAECSRSRRRNDETTERADSRRSAQRERQQRRRYLETVEQTDARRAVDRSRFNVVEMLKPRRTADRSRIQRLRRVQKSAMQTFEAATQKCCHVDVCRMYCTFLPYSVQRNVVNELQVVALFDVQRYGLHDNYVDNLALLYIWAEPQPRARRATAAVQAAVAR